MKTPHFYKAKSRLGMPHIPFRGNELNIGVEDGPDAILSESFLNEFKTYQLDEFTFPTPEETPLSQYYNTLTESLVELKERIKQSLKDNEIQLVIGGDNSVTFSSLLAQIEQKDPKKIGYIQFDTHGECNTFEESATKNFHGMYIRPFFDRFDIAQIERLVPKKLPAENLMFVGNMDLEQTEKDVIAKFQ